MFQLVCDPSGLVVDTTLKELVPAVINWGGKLDHILRVLLSHILGSAQVQPFSEHLWDFTTINYFVSLRNEMLISFEVHLTHKD